MIKQRRFYDHDLKLNKKRNVVTNLFLYKFYDYDGLMPYSIIISKSIENAAKIYMQKKYSIASWTGMLITWELRREYLFISYYKYLHSWDKISDFEEVNGHRAIRCIKKISIKKHELKEGVI